MNRLKELRTDKNLSQAKLAELFNISQQAVSHYEKGSRDIDSALLKNLAKFFNVSTDYLKDELGDILFKQTIRDNVDVIKSTFNSTPVVYFNSRANASKDYKRFVEEMQQCLI